jgi:hypothetical protein
MLTIESIRLERCITNKTDILERRGQGPMNQAEVPLGRKVQAEILSSILETASS